MDNFMRMLAGGGGSGLGTNYFPPAPPAANLFQRLTGSSSRLPSNLASLLSHDVALPMAAALMGNQGNMQNMANALSVAGPALKKNKTEAYLRAQSPEMAEMLDAGMEPADVWRLHMDQQALASQGKKAPQVETFYDEKTGQAYKAQWDSQAGAWSPVGGSKGDEGFEVTTADGTVIRQGSFGTQDKKNVANSITAEQEAAKAASSTKSTVQMLRQANQNTGYSGPGAGVYGAVDDAAEQLGMGGALPGSSSARAAMRGGGVEIVLGNVAKMKGAVSDRETAMLMSAAPGMSQTPQGNAMLLDIADATADRQLERTQEAENWRQEHGTLDGFEAAWGEYVSQNPLFVEDGQGGLMLASKAGVSGGNPAGGAQRTRNGVSWQVAP